MNRKFDQCRNDVVGTSINRILKKFRSIGMPRGRKRHQLYEVVDSRVEHKIVGGDSCHILPFSDEYDELDRSLAVMESGMLLKVNAVTALRIKMDW